MTRPKDLAYALFDFDGVVADTEPLYLELDRQSMIGLGYEPTMDELRGFVGKPSDVMAVELLAKHGITATLEDYRDGRDIGAGIYGNPDLPASPGIEDLWHFLRERGVRIGVVSTTPCADLLRALHRLGLLTYADAVMGRELAARTKPDPDPYLQGLAALAPNDPQAAARAIVVEDSPSGIAAAKAAGIHVVGYRGASVEQDTSEADETCDSFQELIERLR